MYLHHQFMYLLHPPSAVTVALRVAGGCGARSTGPAPDIRILNFSLDSSCQLALQYSTLTPTDRYLPVTRTTDTNIWISLNTWIYVLIDTVVIEICHSVLSFISDSGPFSVGSRANVEALPACPSMNFRY